MYLTMQGLFMARVQASIGTINYAVTLKTRSHELKADEPLSSGGKDAGPAPYELLLASLGACTAITLRMYAERKQWPLEAVHIELNYEKGAERGKITRKLSLQGALSEEQRARFAYIAERTPVTLTLKSGLDIHTELR